MKKNLLLAIACLFAGLLQAQDTLYRVNGTRQIVRIIEVNPAQVRYVPFSDPDGPIYMLSKQAVARIIYENGTVDSFQAIREPGDTPAVILSLEPFNRNILSIYVIDILWDEFTVSYEHLTKSGKWGLKIPFSRSFLKKESRYSGLVHILNDNFYDGVKLFSTGLSLNYYLFGQERITYYIGLSFLYGWHIFNEYYHQYKLGYGKKVDSFTGYTLNNGVFIPLSDNIKVSGQVGIGRGYTPPHENPYIDTRKLRIPVEINICYKF